MQTNQHAAAPPAVDTAAPERPNPPPAIVPFTFPRGYVPPPPTPPIPGAVAAPAAPPTRSRRALGHLTLSLAVLAVGVVALVDVAGANVPASIYFGAPLTMIGGGLVLGAWFGRARGLIGAGIVLSVLLAIAAGVETWGPVGSHGSVSWRPASIGQLAASYRIGAGDAVLDLSGLDFTDRTVTVEAHVSVGNLRIVLPATVDVEVHSTVGVGNATVLGQQWDGIRQGEHTVTDNGADGPGGGRLTIDATVNLGDLEVRR